MSSSSIHNELKELKSRKRKLEKMLENENDKKYIDLVESIAQDLHATVEVINLPNSVKYNNTSHNEFGRRLYSCMYFVFKFPKEKVRLGFGMPSRPHGGPCLWLITASENEEPNLPLCSKKEVEQKTLAITHETQQLIPKYILQQLDKIVQTSGIDKYDYTEDAKTYRYFPVEREERMIYHYTVKSNKQI